MKTRIQELAQSFFPEIKAIRRHLHQHPELSFQEVETSRFLREKLDTWGLELEINYPIAGEGFSVDIIGEQPGGVTLLRADMDALPIQEETTVPFKSVHNGVMHACGHDMHSSCLMGAIKILHACRAEIKGRVRCMFQPGEEKLPGGASLMIAEGILENPTVDRAIALHVFPDLEVGKVGFRSGMYMASCDEIYMTVKGVGGHGAMPHKVKDSVLAAASIITGLQSIVARSCPPEIPSVLSFGKIEAAGATNVIPSTVSLAGTFRTLNETWRTQAHDLISQKSEAIAASLGCGVEVDIRKGYPFLSNDTSTTQAIKNTATDYLGEKNIVDLPLRMTGEDFAFIAQKVPTCFFRLGTRNEALGQIHGVHHPAFEPNENALEIGMGLLAYAVLNS